MPLHVLLVTRFNTVFACCDSVADLECGTNADFALGRWAKDATMHEQRLNFVGPRESAFHVSPNPRFYYPSPAHDTVLAELMHGIESRQGMLVLTGEAGTGKTLILNYIMDWLRQRGRSTAFIFHTHVEPIGLLRLILTDLGLPCESKAKSHLVTTLHEWLLRRNAANDLPVLILDEAQALPLRTLDELRLILNLETYRGKALQIILCGQPELEEKLWLPALKPLRQRIMFHSRLRVLTEKETAAYISRRLEVAGYADLNVFSEEVVQRIYSISQGIPRVINLLCEHALIATSADETRGVTPEMIQQIAVEYDLGGVIAAPTANESRSWHRHVPSLARQAEQSAEGEVPAPVSERSEEASPLALAAAAGAGIGQSVGAVSIPRTVAVPAPVPAPPQVAVTPAAPASATKAPAAQPWMYWRKHRPKSSLAVLVQSSVSTVTQVWGTVWASLLEWARRGRQELLAVLEKSKPRTIDKARMMKASWMTQIEFDMFDKPGSSAARKRIRLAMNERVVPAPVAAPVALASPGAQLHHAVPAANSIKPGMSKPIVAYGRAVLDSFARDCRTWFRDCSLMFRVSTVPTAAPGMSAPVGDNRQRLRSTRQRNALGVFDWLRQPMNPTRAARRGSPKYSNQRR